MVGTSVTTQFILAVNRPHHDVLIRSESTLVSFGVICFIWKDSSYRRNV